MRKSSPFVLVTTVATSLALSIPPTLASPLGEAPEERGRGLGNGAERNEVASDIKAQKPAKAKPSNSASDLAYPRQQVLPLPAVNNADASLKLGVIPYHEMAPRLNALQQQSDRVSVEVIGQSVQGRDLYLVTVTAPESNGEANRQRKIRDRISQDPIAAAKDPSITKGYKASFMVNANIHGNEWEGTDGALQLLEELALSKDPAVGEMLGRTRVYSVLTVNPDGRVNNTRANAAGFDMNRDYITASQPETRASRDALIKAQPLVFLDQHGYVAGTLIEPGTAPHAQNAEYDLYIKHALPNAEGMEAALQKSVEDGSLAPEALTTAGNAIIPFRDDEPGDWDDWPPIFTPMYAMLHGSVGHTIEFPLRVNGRNYTELTSEVLRGRAVINTKVAYETTKAALAYTDANRDQLIADQIETFRRGAAGEQHVGDLPLGFVPGYGVEDQGYTTEFPRAYVIPSGEDQRSAVAAARLVDHLVVNDVRVTRADKAFSLAGKSYAPGSYVVDMHQPKRGVANVMLEAGRDISLRVPQMYDISGWSHRLLWGASVDIAVTGNVKVVGRAVAVASPTGAVNAKQGQALALELVDGKDVAAANALLDQGIALGLAADGTVVVPASARAAAVAAADRFGVRFTPATSAVTKPMSRTVIAAAAAADELKVLRDMGFEVRPVSTATINNEPAALEGADVLFVSAGLVFNSLNPAAKVAVGKFFTSGGVVTRGATGADFNAQAKLLTVTTVAGSRSANGVVKVTNTDGPVTDGASDSSFVYGPRWFVNPGPEVTVEQSYAATDVLTAGHWVPLTDAGSVVAAAGQASIVRGTDESGASVVLFGTEPMFRDHPKGLFSQVGRAVLHTSVNAAVVSSAK